MASLEGVKAVNAYKAKPSLWSRYIGLRISGVEKRSFKEYCEAEMEMEKETDEAFRACFNEKKGGDQ